MEKIQALLKTVHRLRAPGGCPWDREQTHQSLKRFLYEEVAEIVEVLEQLDPPGFIQAPDLRSSFIEEWGDVLLQLLLHVEIANESLPEKDRIDLEMISDQLNQKLIRRHPHVFGETEVSRTAEVLSNWEEIKKKEKQKTPTSYLAGIPKGLPPIAKAQKIIDKVTRVGFQWPDLQGPIAKIEEELDELKKAKTDQEQMDELGDLLFSVINVAFLLKMDPEKALQKNLDKFKRRFDFVERSLKRKGIELKDANLSQMDEEWNHFKSLPKRIAITGGIASGKSTVVKAFQSLGVPSVDADVIARKLRSEHTETGQEILRVFGTLDPAILRQKIQSSPLEKRLLEKILHPAIAQQSLSEIEVLQATTQAPIVLYEATLLFEAGRAGDFDAVIWVESEEEIRIQRLMKRDHVSRESAQKMIAAQGNLDWKRALCQYEIINTSSTKELEDSVQSLLQRMA